MSPKRNFVLGRNKLRANLAALLERKKGYRIMSITGARGTGKSHSWHLIQHVARTSGIVPVRVDVAGGLRMEEACEIIAGQMGFDTREMKASVIADQPSPDRVGRKFASWLLRKTRARKSNRWWLVIDGLDESDGGSPELRECLVQWLIRSIAGEQPPADWEASSYDAPSDPDARPKPDPNGRKKGPDNLALILLGSEIARDPRLAQCTLHEHLELLRNDAVRDFFSAYFQSVGKTTELDFLDSLVTTATGGDPGPYPPERLSEIVDAISLLLEHLKPWLETADEASLDPASSRANLQMSLASANRPRQQTSPLDPYRSAAAVLVAFDPATVRPVPGLPAPRNAIPLLPELIPSPFLEDQDIFPWALPVPSRKRALARMNTKAELSRALEANHERPDTLLQRTLTAAIEGRQFSMDALDSNELNALLTVSEWLVDTEVGRGLPRPHILREESGRRRDVTVLTQLASDVFTGREGELARVRQHIQRDDEKILFISGVGGTGKSALLAHSLLTWQSAMSSEPEWVRIDLDNSIVQPEKPYTVAVEAARQLKRRHPQYLTILEDFIKGVTSTESSSDEARLEMAQSTRIDPLRQRWFSLLNLLLAKPDARLVVWIDTFEEAQFLGAHVATSLLNFLRRSATQMKNLRVIVSGRSPLQESDESNRFPKKYVRNMPLRDLSQEAAKTLLGKLMEKFPAAPTLKNAALAKAARALRGNPLTLRLGAALIAKEGAVGLKDLTNLRAQAQQRWLYTRILEHLHESDDIGNLAMPGLIVRRITPEVIMEVLAGPCKLGALARERADGLFATLEAEIALMERDKTDGSLRHRQDVRLLMLEGLTFGKDDLVQEIDANAVKFWSNRKGPIARAEEIYHRLRLKQPQTILNERWQPEAAPFLRAALAEFPTKSPERLWLAGQLNAVLDSTETADVEHDEWEKQAALEAQRCLASGDAQEALRILSRRKKRLPGSRLYGIHARACLRLGDSAEALVHVRQGIKRAFPKAAPVGIDLLLLESFIHERQRDFGRAGKAASRAYEQANRLTDERLQLSAGVRLMRIARVSHKNDTSDMGLVLQAIIEEFEPRSLIAHPALLRELAAELGGEQPEVLRMATEQFLDEMLLSLENRETLDLLERMKLNIAAQRESLLSAHKDELVKWAHHMIDEALYASNTDKDNVAARELQRLFQSSVDSLLSAEYGAAPVQSQSAIPPASDPFSTQPHLRTLLENAVAEAPQDALRDIARFQLRTDISRISAGNDAAAMAKDFVDRAVNLGRVPEVVQQLSRMLPAASKVAKLVVEILGFLKL